MWLGPLQGAHKTKCFPGAPCGIPRTFVRAGFGFGNPLLRLRWRGLRFALTSHKANFPQKGAQKCILRSVLYIFRYGITKTIAPVLTAMSAPWSCGHASSFIRRKVLTTWISSLSIVTLWPSIFYFGFRRANVSFAIKVSIYMSRCKIARHARI